MIGIGYNSKIMVYNQIGGKIGEPLTWYGKELSNVRVELREAISASVTGKRAENACIVKVHDADFAYVTPEIWAASENKLGAVTFQTGKTFFIITDKADIGVSITAPAGVLLDSSYNNGLIEYLAKTYGRVYEVNTVDHYSLIPHWEIGGK